MLGRSTKLIIQNSYKFTLKGNNNVKGVPTVLNRNFSWFKDLVGASTPRNFSDLKSDESKLQFLRSLQRFDAKEVIRNIEKGWAGGFVPTTEPFIKEYLKAAASLKRLDSIDLNGLFSMIGSKTAAIEGGASGSANAVQMQMILSALANQRSAGDSPDRPLFTAIRPPGLKDQLWKLFITLASGFLVMSFIMTVVDPKQLASKMGISNNTNVKQAENPDKTFEDVVGVDEAKGELEEIVQYLRDPQKFTRLGGKLPKGVLLTGPPGTGKTLLARAIAGEAGVPFFYSSGSEFEEMYVGVGAKRVRDLFAAANANSPCIIFIDEIDAVGGSRHLKDQSAMKMTLNQLLVEMDGFQENSGVIVIAATNFADSLDKALLRPGRFDKHVDVPLPDVAGRKAILQLYSKKMPMGHDVDLDQLARGTPGFSGAELYNLMNQAAVKASMLGDVAISMGMLEWAKDKSFAGAEKKSALLSPETMRLTAFHEAGHAIVGILTDGADPVHKATIMPRGRALGFVLQLPDGDQTSMSYKEMKARLDVCMGGRIAEELVFGGENVTSGASNDISQATRLARDMVTKYGLSQKVGPVNISNDDNGGGRSAVYRISDETLDLVDKEIKRIIEESYNRVKALLNENKAKLERVALGLLQYETLSGAEIVELMNGNPLSSRTQKPSRELKEIPIDEEARKKKKQRQEQQEKQLLSNSKPSGHGGQPIRAPSPIRSSSPMVSQPVSKPVVHEKETTKPAELPSSSAAAAKEEPTLPEGKSAFPSLKSSLASLSDLFKDSSKESEPAAIASEPRIRGPPSVQESKLKEPREKTVEK